MKGMKDMRSTKLERRTERYYLARVVFLYAVFALILGIEPVPVPLPEEKDAQTVTSAPNYKEINDNERRKSETVWDFYSSRRAIKTEDAFNDLHYSNSKEELESGPDSRGNGPDSRGNGPDSRENGQNGNNERMTNFKGKKKQIPNKSRLFSAQGRKPLPSPDPNIGPHLPANHLLVYQKGYSDTPLLNFKVHNVSGDTLSQSGERLKGENVNDYLAKELKVILSKSSRENEFNDYRSGAFRGLPIGSGFFAEGVWVCPKFSSHYDQRTKLNYVSPTPPKRAKLEERAFGESPANNGMSEPKTPRPFAFFVVEDSSNNVVQTLQPSEIYHVTVTSCDGCGERMFYLSVKDGGSSNGGETGSFVQFVPGTHLLRCGPSSIVGKTPFAANWTFESLTNLQRIEFSLQLEGRKGEGHYLSFPVAPVPVPGSRIQANGILGDEPTRNLSTFRTTHSDKVNVSLSRSNSESFKSDSDDSASRNRTHSAIIASALNQNDIKNILFRTDRHKRSAAEGGSLAAKNSSLITPDNPGDVGDARPRTHNKNTHVMPLESTSPPQTKESREKQISSNGNSCDPFWTSWKDRCLFVSGEKSTWWKAEELCETMAARLISVTSSDVSEELDRITRNTPEPSSRTFWIGASDQVSENSFVWIGGEKFSYTDWFPGWPDQSHYNSQPSDDGLSGEDCVELRNSFRLATEGSRVTSKLFWNDRTCDVLNRFICSKSKFEDSVVGGSSNASFNGSCDREIPLAPWAPAVVVTSPRFLSAYPRGVSCVTKLEAPPQSSITLIFDAFHLRDEPPCSSERLEIWDGDLLVKKALCGDWSKKLKLLRYVSHTNKVLLTFKTDVIPSTGFKMRATVTSGGSGCGSRWQTRFGNTCLMVADDPQVTWNTASRICNEAQGSLLKIRDPVSLNWLDSWLSSHPRFSPETRYWVGGMFNSGSGEWVWEDWSPIDLESVELPADHVEPEPYVRLCLSLELKATSRKGFRHSHKSSQALLSLTAHFCDGFGGYICLKKHEKTTLMQNRTIYGREGNLTSPDFPNLYPNDAHTLTTISGPPNSRLILKVKKLSLEYQEDCLYDYVGLSDNSEGREMLRYCGHQAVDEKRVYISTSNEILVTFHSDWAGSGGGMLADWWAVDVGGCPLTVLRDPTAIITSPNYPNFNLADMHCSTVIEAPVGQFIWLQFDVFDVSGNEGKALEDDIEGRSGKTSYSTSDVGSEPTRHDPSTGSSWAYSKDYRRNTVIPSSISGRCHDNYVEVVLSDSRKVKLCGNIRSGDVATLAYVSSDNVLKVILRTSKTVAGKGFKAHYKIGSRFEESAVVKMSDYPKDAQPLEIRPINYPYVIGAHSLKFRRHVVAPHGYRLNVMIYHVAEIATQGTPCHQDYLEIEDWYAGRAGTTWRICRFDPTSPKKVSLSSTFNSFFIKEVYSSSENIVKPKSAIKRKHKSSPAGTPTTTTPPSSSGSPAGRSEFLANFENETTERHLENLFLIRKKNSVPSVVVASELDDPIDNTTAAGGNSSVGHRRASSIYHFKISFSLIADPDWINRSLNVPDDSKRAGVSSCAPPPCLRGTKCLSSASQYFCVCEPGYTGVFCQVKWCDVNPCVSGQCHETGTGFNCQCQPGWEGERCEKRVSPCAGDPCQGRGECSVMNNTFHCRCHAWWEGPKCGSRLRRIPYKPLSERMIEEPFWLGLITVAIVMGCIGVVFCIKKHFADKIEKFFAEEIEKSKYGGVTSSRLNPLPSPTGLSPVARPKSLLVRLNSFRKASLLSISSTASSPRGEGPSSALDEFLKPGAKRGNGGACSPRRGPSKSRSQTTSPRVESKNILRQLITPPAPHRAPSFDELLHLRSQNAKCSIISEEFRRLNRSASPETPRSCSVVIERTRSADIRALQAADSDVGADSHEMETSLLSYEASKHDKRVTFARLMNKFQKDLSSSSSDISTADDKGSTKMMSIINAVTSKRSPRRSPKLKRTVRHSGSGSEEVMDTPEGSSCEMTPDPPKRLLTIKSASSPSSKTSSPQNRSKLNKISSADSLLAMFRAIGSTGRSSISSPSSPHASEFDISSSQVSPSTTPGSPPKTSPSHKDSLFVPDFQTEEQELGDQPQTVGPTITLEVPSDQYRCLSPITELPTPVPTPMPSPLPTPSKQHVQQMANDSSTCSDSKEVGRSSSDSSSSSESKVSFRASVKKNKLAIDCPKLVLNSPGSSPLCSPSSPSSKGKAYPICFPHSNFLNYSERDDFISVPMILVEDEECDGVDRFDTKPRSRSQSVDITSMSKVPLITVSCIDDSPPSSISDPPSSPVVVPVFSMTIESSDIRNSSFTSSINIGNGSPFGYTELPLIVTTAVGDGDSDPGTPVDKIDSRGATTKFLSPLLTSNIHTTSEGNLSSSGYSSAYSPGPSRCSSNTRLSAVEMEDPLTLSPISSQNVPASLRIKRHPLLKCSPVDQVSKVSHEYSLNRTDSETTDPGISSQPEQDSAFELDTFDETQDSNNEYICSLSSTSPCFDQDNEIGTPRQKLYSCSSSPLQSSSPILFVQSESSHEDTVKLSPASSRSDSPITESRLSVHKIYPAFNTGKLDLPYTDSDCQSSEVFYSDSTRSLSGSGRKKKYYCKLKESSSIFTYGIRGGKSTRAASLDLPRLDQRSLRRSSEVRRTRTPTSADLLSSSSDSLTSASLNSGFPSPVEILSDLGCGELRDLTGDRQTNVPKIRRRFCWKRKRPNLGGKSFSCGTIERRTSNDASGEETPEELRMRRTSRPRKLSRVRSLDKIRLQRRLQPTRVVRKMEEPKDSSGTSDSNLEDDDPPMRTKRWSQS